MPLLAIAIFITLFLVVALCAGLGLAFNETRQRKHVRAMLKAAEEPEIRQAKAVLVRAEADAGALTERLKRLPLYGSLERMLQQSQAAWTPDRFLLMSVAGLLIGAIAGSQINSPLPRSRVMLGLALLGAILPLLIAIRKRSKTLAAFEKQFPDALDFLSRSMRAGHGFAISIEMLAGDTAEPLASAFLRVAHEMQLGSSLNAALSKMEALVPSVDVRFFVSAVVLQQETGGNLSEILNKLAYVIRERFRLRGQVKAMSAHGRITGMVLLLMPVAVTLILLATTPNYLEVLTNDKYGRMMIYGAVGGQVLAYFAIKKIVNIKV